MLNHAGSDKHKSRLKLCRLTMILAGCWPLPLTTQPSASWWMSSRRRVLIISNRAVEVQDSKNNSNWSQPSPTWSPMEDRVNSHIRRSNGSWTWCRNAKRLEHDGAAAGTPSTRWWLSPPCSESLTPWSLQKRVWNPRTVGSNWHYNWERFEWFECTARNHRPPMIPNVSVRTSTLGSGSMAPIPCRLQNFLPPRCSQMLPKAVRHGQSFDSVRFRVASHVTSSSDITLNW